MTPKDQHQKLKDRIKEMSREAQEKAAAVFKSDGLPPPKIGGRKKKKHDHKSQGERCAERENKYPRLPDGTSISKIYLAGRGTWSIKLAVPAVRTSPADAPFYVEFFVVHSSAHMGEQVAVDKYHAWLKGNAGRELSNGDKPS